MKAPDSLDCLLLSQALCLRAGLRFGCVPALRVFRAETRLTVYRACYILGLCQLVGIWRGSARIGDFDKKIAKLKGLWFMSAA